MTELKVNPFAYRLCEVFAQSEEFLMFEEFLDMMSVLSEAAPPQESSEPINSLQVSAVSVNLDLLGLA